MLCNKQFLQPKIFFIIRGTNKIEDQKLVASLDLLQSFEGEGAQDCLKKHKKYFNDIIFSRIFGAPCKNW